MIRAAVLAAVTLAVPGSSAIGGDIRVHVAGGWAIARDRHDPESYTSSLGALFDDGWAAGIGVEWRFADRVAFVADLDHARFAFDTHNNVRYSHLSENGFVIQGDAASATSFEATVRARLAGARRLVPYLAAGVGLDRVAYEVVTREQRLDGRGGTITTVTPVRATDVAPVLVGAAGIEVQLGAPFSAAAEWRYRHAFMDRQRILRDSFEGAPYSTARIALSVRIGGQPQ